MVTVLCVDPLQGGVKVEVRQLDLAALVSVHRLQGGGNRTSLSAERRMDPEHTRCIYGPQFIVAAGQCEGAELGPGGPGQRAAAGRRSGEGAAHRFPDPERWHHGECRT